MTSKEVLADIAWKLEQAQDHRRRAAKEWEDAIRHARYYGLSYTKISRLVHLNEAAVRFYCKRHGIR